MDINEPKPHAFDKSLQKQRLLPLPQIAWREILGSKSILVANAKIKDVVLVWGMVVFVTNQYTQEVEAISGIFQIADLWCFTVRFDVSRCCVVCLCVSEAWLESFKPTMTHDSARMGGTFDSKIW